MKKILIIIIGLVIVLLSIFFSKYIDYKAKKNEIKQFNLEYEEYNSKEIYGTELTTVINKAVDNNEKNNVKKDEQGLYIQNNTNSIQIEIKITDNDTTYQMETLYGGGMVTFVQYYNFINFKCTEIKYNKAGKICYMMFEQIST